MTQSATDIILSRLEQEIASNNTTWNIGKGTVVFLQSLLRDHRPMRVLEIGTSTGYSAICIAQVLNEWSGQLTTVESHKERFALAQKNIADTGLQNITQIQGHAPEILREIPGMFDFIFLDATKYEHTSYFLALKNRLSAGGIVVADNMLSHEKEMQEYKKTVEADPQFESSIENVDTGLLVSKRII
jgi:predicted O-methyltransferase YrrM